MPLWVLLDFPLGIGFGSSMVVHGLWYDDRFEFAYDTSKHYSNTVTEEDEQPGMWAPHDGDKGNLDTESVRLQQSEGAESSCIEPVHQAADVTPKSSAL